MQKAFVAAAVLLFFSAFAGTVKIRIDCASHTISKMLFVTVESYVMQDPNNYTRYYSWDRSSYSDNPARKGDNNYYICDITKGGQCLVINHRDGYCWETFDFEPSAQNNTFEYDSSTATQCPYSDQRDCVQYCKESDTCIILDSTKRVVGEETFGVLVTTKYIDTPFTADIFAVDRCSGGEPVAPKDFCSQYKY